MILIPNFDGCTFIGEDNYCYIRGSLPDVLSKALISEVALIDEDITVIFPTIKNVSVVMDSPASRYCCDYLTSIGVIPKSIERSSFKKVFKGAV